MRGLTKDTFQRPDDLSDRTDPNVLYARSYLLIRLVVGGVGILLPTLLLILDSAFLTGRSLVRGSLSAYYHTSARDLFVGALCITGFFLMTYMAGRKRTWDFWLSSIAGVAVLGVAFLPTQRPNLAETAPLCGPGSLPVPAGCTQLQQAFGETQVATVHFTSAAIFIVSLAFLCLVFGGREKTYAGNVASARFHRFCGGAIFAGVLWIGLGLLLKLDVFGLTPLYVGEVVSVYAFGLSWLVKAKDLFPTLKNLLPR